MPSSNPTSTTKESDKPIANSTTHAAGTDGAVGLNRITQWVAVLTLTLLSITITQL